MRPSRIEGFIAGLRRRPLALLLGATLALSASISCGSSGGAIGANDHAPNRLASEKSPYLLQHAHNPVDWYPWGEEAFERARREDRPIFLSIGYSTCHWCHVMERESFENDSVAALMNRVFVCIKVDREERPDVDRVYMTAMQTMGLGGGWPLNVFLTPDRKPFFGGTYFPPETRAGRIGLRELIPRIEQAWRERRADLESSGERVMAHLSSIASADTGAADRLALFEAAARDLEAAEDALHGGFGSSPKFPTAGNLAFLMRHWARDTSAHSRSLALVLRQLDAMRAGGIHDQIGGGFHRYTVDREWLTPHFEKMLYDQAQLAWAYMEAHQVTGRPEYAEAARGIFDYVARDLTSPEGAFFSAEDADSEGEEGLFYVWRPSELHAVLGARDAALVAMRYGVSEQGNFEHGASILHENVPLSEVARRQRRSVDETSRLLAAARTKLLNARSKRVRPHLDDKVLTAWNGLMISAYARGARVLRNPEYAKRAERAADFVWSRLYDSGTRSLHRRWRDGEAAMPGQLSDYADLALGFIDLHGATQDPKWLERAVLLTECQIERFWDEADGGFFDSPSDDPHLAIRLKDHFDGAETAGNSVALSNLQLLGTLLDREEWLVMAKRGFDHFARRLDGRAAGMAQMLAAMFQELSVPRHVVVVGGPADPATKRLRGEFDSRFLPHDLLIVAGTSPPRRELDRLLPFIAPLTPQGGRATAYVCVEHACRLPTTDAREFGAQLEATRVTSR